MIHSFVFLFLCCFSYAQRQLPRISGGDTANITEVPYQLAIEIEMDGNMKQVCGAAIIHPYWALTAAHCVYGLPESQARLRSGSGDRMQGGTLHDLNKIIVHPYFGRNTADYDVAVIQVIQEFKFSDVAQSISLACKTPSAGTRALVTGWGQMGFIKPKAKQLQKVTVIIDSEEKCKSIYSDWTPRMFCAGDPIGSKNACLGDSGGPLVVNNQIAGIVSWGYNCARVYYPRVYTDVAKVRNWVISSIEKESKYH